MRSPNQEKILNKIRDNLGRSQGKPLVSIPKALPPRKMLPTDDEIDLLIQEINSLSGSATRIPKDKIRQELSNLIEAEGIRKACMWDTPFLTNQGIASLLSEYGVEVIPLQSEKSQLAQCDLGITEVDYAISYTGTLCLLSSPIKPRTTSLLPRVHLAIVRPENLRSDLHQVLDEAKNSEYFVFITGPSRTADIELTVALGVHGPQRLYAWVIP